eukprot:TRINITY_DN111859_c0_g1_i1.p2 TRINITY_DN111859_c0_g1~~TRINITY_DN111859_c0_g1_i1.p2  ORF type:complete len:243 (-),score=49.85 TRINITY_DN111859_c0_g1_i1:48-776(-)
MQRNLVESDQATWNSLIKASEAQGAWRRVVSLMQTLRGRSMRLRSMDYTAAASVCGGSRERWFSALAVGEALSAAGLELSAITGTALSSAFGCTFQWSRVVALLLRLGARRSCVDVFSLNAAVTATGAAGVWQGAVTLFYQMLQMRVQPQECTYNALVAAYAESGKLWQPWDVLKSMSQSGLEADDIGMSAALGAAVTGDSKLRTAGDMQRMLDVLWDVEAFTKHRFERDLLEIMSCCQSAS